jgi:hypothetical protein
MRPEAWYLTRMSDKDDRDIEAVLRDLSDKFGGPVSFRNGWFVLPSRGGPPVTNDLVQRLLDEADLEDAGLGPSAQQV